MAYWFLNNYGKDNIAVSTRARIARNINNIPFPSVMNNDEAEKLINEIKTAVSKSNDGILKELKFINMKDVPHNERFAMAERHIISREFANSSRNNCLLLSADESISIMIGEEDHIRIQVLKSGFCPKEVYEIAEKIDRKLCDILPIAYDKNLGFLTECPTNLGTGLRISVMLHLPMLEAMGEVDKIRQSLNKIGFTIRGMFGEGSKPLSSFYQISNQVTLGITENDAINNLTVITNELTEREKEKRETLNKIGIEDRCSRSLYTLKGAKILSSNEMMKLLSDIMLGINLSIIDENVIYPVKSLIECSPYNLMSKHGEISADDRDILRAKTVSDSINLK